MDKYYHVSKLGAPKREALRLAHESLQVTLKTLAAAKAQLQEVQAPPRFSALALSRRASDRAFVWGKEKRKGRGKGKGERGGGIPRTRPQRISTNFT